MASLKPLSSSDSSVGFGVGCWSGVSLAFEGRTSWISDSLAVLRTIGLGWVGSRGLKRGILKSL